jgi:hypothetical protein
LRSDAKLRKKSTLKRQKDRISTETKEISKAEFMQAMKEKLVA